MSVATTTAIGIAAGVGAAGAIGGAAISSNAASNAAGAQVSAANQAANLQHQDAQAALNQNQQQFQTTQNNIAPWLGVGRGALANLAYQMGIPLDGMTIPGTGTPGTPGVAAVPPSSGMVDKNLARGSDFGPDQFQMDTAGAEGSPAIPGTPGTPATSLSSLVNPNLGAAGSLVWKAPTDVTEQNDPGFQFRLAQGQKAIEQSAAARGGLLSGGTAKALGDYSQNQASNEYSNVYNRALNDYNTRFNSLAGLAGVGQQAAGTLGNLGAANSAQNTNILLTSGQQIGQDLNNAGAATASGYVGAGNAWNGALGSLGNTASQLGLLSLLGGNGGGGGGPVSTAGLPLTGSGFNFGGLIPTASYGG